MSQANLPIAAVSTGRLSSANPREVFAAFEQPDRLAQWWGPSGLTLTARGDETHLAWVQEFESPEVAATMRRLTDTANEQNLDRLQSLLAATAQPHELLTNHTAPDRRTLGPS